MTDGQRRHITLRPDGQWADKAEGNDRASGLYDTQRQAQRLMRSTAALVVARSSSTDRTAKFGDSNTINRPDPFPPRG